MTHILQAATVDQVEEARRLFVEYGESLGFSLCFQSFDQELAGLPGDYAPPSGRLLLAESDGQVAGCVALHRLEDGVCEMKRLYVRPAFRGKKIGLALANAVIAEAQAIGYARMRLDTIAASMKEAVAMYRTLGFVEIPPYRPNPIESALYMELKLS
ncbi:MAG: GNAT family N-acetyltransferase [Acidobacteria bacterium]|nr:GNAT family N-acetyltransferase [Acidobacteriota bacterium]